MRHPTNESGKSAQVSPIPGPRPIDVPQTSEVSMIPDPHEHGPAIQDVDAPPVEPADQPSTPPPYAGHTPSYGPNPTSQGVRGYRDLPADDVALINAVKELQENVANVWAAIYLRPGIDRRWAAISRTHLEEGVSALVRSIAQPHDPFQAALGTLAADAQERSQETKP